MQAIKSDGTPLPGIPSIFGTSLQAPTHAPLLSSLHPSLTSDCGGAHRVMNWAPTHF